MTRTVSQAGTGGLDVELWKDLDSEVEVIASEFSHFHTIARQSSNREASPDFVVDAGNKTSVGWLSLGMNSHQESTALDSLWRGPAEIWTQAGWRVGFRGEVRYAQTGGELTVELPKMQVAFTVADVVFARRYLLPVPSLTVIFKQGAKYGLVSFFLCGKGSCARLAEACGLEIDEVKMWRTGLEAGRDQRAYGLSR